MWRLFTAALLALSLLAGCITIATPFGVVQVDYAPDWTLPTRTLTPTVKPSLTVAPTETPEPTPSAEFATSQPPLRGRVNTTKLNIRSAPGVNNPDIGDLFLGNVVFIIGQNEANTWYQVENEDGVLLGWVDARYVELYRG